MVPFKPFVFIQVRLTDSPHRQLFVVVVFKILEHCPQVQGSVAIKTVNENLLLSSSPSVPSICRKVYQKELSGRRLRLIRETLFTFGVSLKSGELINFNATCTSKLDLQLIQVLKGAFCHYLEGQQTNLNGRRRISPSARAMQMNFDTSDSCVNALIVADFNLSSRAIQGDTQRFDTHRQGGFCGRFF